jgi:hypothetical protein
MIQGVTITNSNTESFIFVFHFFQLTPDQKSDHMNTQKKRKKQQRETTSPYSTTYHQQKIQF